jgi:hypothetical protein
MLHSPSKIESQLKIFRDGAKHLGGVDAGTMSAACQKRDVWFRTSEQILRKFAVKKSSSARRANCTGISERTDHDLLRVEDRLESDQSPARLPNSPSQLGSPQTEKKRIALGHRRRWGGVIVRLRPVDASGTPHD